MAETNPEEFLRRHPAPVVIDEIQYAPALFRYLKHAIDQKRHIYGQYILTGSQKFSLMKSVSDSLAGRCGICELETMSLPEVRQHSAISIEDLIVKGGYPELHARPELDCQDYYNSYIATYLERDVRSLLKVHQLRDFERFVRAVALRSGQTLNKADLARDVGISAPTANEWLSVLEASNQICFLEPWFANKTKTLIKAPKLYLADSGLLCHLLNITTEASLSESPLKGAIWETFVFSELRKRSSQPSFWLWRDHRGLEVDFLSQSGGNFFLFEAKWSEHPEKKDAANLVKVAETLGLSAVKGCRIICRTPAPYRLSLGDDRFVDVSGVDADMPGVR
jgi:predicted AAA+ superfamily ATPase